jgi:alanine racemase
MDLTMLDVTDVPCDVGDVVTALGAPHRAAGGSWRHAAVDAPRGPSQSPAGDLLTLDEVAASGDLSPYELLTGWRLRLPRVYRQST